MERDRDKKSDIIFGHGHFRHFVDQEQSVDQSIKLTFMIHKIS